MDRLYSPRDFYGAIGIMGLEQDIKVAIGQAALFYSIRSILRSIVGDQARDTIEYDEPGGYWKWDNTV